MNPMDRALASGAWKPMPAIFPMVLGVDGAGVVVPAYVRSVERWLATAAR
jgi:NADPH:quinone reductase-like Zn-dependent oxidoreductase